MSLGVTLPGVNLISPDEEQAWLENQSMYGDGKTPGSVGEPRPELENLEIHMRVHKFFAATPEVRMASPAVQAAFSEHITLTGMYMQPNPVPPAFDSDLRGSDAEDLEEDMEMNLAISPDSLLASQGIVG